MVILNPDGTLSKTDIGTTDDRPGWALRIRDSVAAKLAEISATDNEETRNESQGN